MGPESINPISNSTLSLPGKIAVITNIPYHTQNEEEFWSGEQVLTKYGPDKVIHITWPAFFVQEKEQVDAIISTLSLNMEIKVIVINQAVQGCNAAVEKLRKLRDDIFIVYCVAQENTVETAALVDLVLTPDRFSIGSLIIKQAKKQGAKTFVHYSFPRHMSGGLKVICRDLMRENCAAEGLEFVEAVAIDPLGESGVFSAEQFILDDVPRMVTRYGENTAFFTTNCFLQVPLIKVICDTHAIFPQPCCPSPYHGFPDALGIETGEGIPDINYIINETARIAASKNMTGRLSTWPAPLTMMSTNAGVEYGIKWMKEKVPKTGIDDQVLMDCMTNYIKEIKGRDVEIKMTPLSTGGKVYNNFKLLLMNYLDY